MGPYSYQTNLDIFNKPLKSWKQLFGPEVVNGDNFTSTTRHNFSNPLSFPAVAVTGFLQNKKESDRPQVFQSNNIVMV